MQKLMNMNLTKTGVFIMNRREFINHTGIYCTDDIERHHGGHWFSKGAKNFFNSRWSDQTFYNAEKNFIFFVSSEKYDYKSPRLYTIRSYDPTTDEISTVGDFQQYASLNAAKRAASKLEE